MKKAALFKAVSLCAGTALGVAAFVTPAFAQTYYQSPGTENLVCNRYSPTCMLQQWDYETNETTYGGEYGYSPYSNYGYSSYPSYSYNTYNNLPNGDYYPYTTIYSTPPSTYTYSYQYQYQYGSTMPAYVYPPAYTSNYSNEYPQYSYPYGYSYP